MLVVLGLCAVGTACSSSSSSRSTDADDSGTDDATAGDPDEGDDGNVDVGSMDLPPDGPTCDVDFGDPAIVDRAIEHLRAIEKITKENGGNRMMGSPGLTTSLEYIEGILDDVDFELERDEYVYERWWEPSFRDGFEQLVPSGGPSYDSFVFPFAWRGEAIGTVTPVDGCGSTALDGFTSGTFALVQLDTCGDPEDFVVRAEQAGAIGVLGDVMVPPTLGDPGVDIPVAIFAESAGYMGDPLRTRADQGTVEVRVFIEDVDREAIGTNLHARHGGASTNAETIVVGAHLDSVLRSPGINDNASGAAMILAIAEALAECETSRTIQFSWWDGEEQGLLGSTAFVESLDAASVAQTAAYLNFDMVASPNYVLGVYRGSSVDIEASFEAQLVAAGTRGRPVALSEDSDYLPFAQAGIAVGGMTTLAGDLKTKAEADYYGGQAGVPYDPCYHEACDDGSSLSEEALGYVTAAAGHVIYDLASAGTDE